MAASVSLAAKEDAKRRGVTGRVISGYSGDDTIKGGAGADTIDGGAGIDKLLYWLLADRRVGRPQCRHWFPRRCRRRRDFGHRRPRRHQLGRRAAGHGGVNVLYGHAGDDTLNGRGGADEMAWRRERRHLLCRQFVGQGLRGRRRQARDTVFTSVSYALAAGQEVEILATTNAAGLGPINLTGNAVAPDDHGNAGANIIMAAAAPIRCRASAATTCTLSTMPATS